MILPPSPSYPASVTPTEAKLVCLECGTRSEDGAGWRAEVVVDVDGDESDEVVVYCPGCWQSEFAPDAS